MAESCENVELSLLCNEYTSSYENGRLTLPIPFVEEYGKVLPNRLYMEFACGHAWSAFYVRDSGAIEGLEKMMQFYGFKPYNLIILHYNGGPFFKVEIFNEFSVEIPYPLACYEKKTTVRTRKSSPLEVIHNFHFSNVDLAKIRAALYLNAKKNFYGLHELVVSDKDLKLDNHYEVLNLDSCNKLGLSFSMSSLDLVFHRKVWTIGLTWKKNRLFFDKKWYEFLKEAKIKSGDVCVLCKTERNLMLRVGVLPLDLVQKYSKLRDGDGMRQGCKWLKFLDSISLHAGELEIPRLFSMTYGNEISENINLKMSNGKKFKAKFNSEKNSVYGLRTLFEKNSIDDGCVIFFCFVGESTFELSVFDPLGIDHLKEITGEYFTEEMINGSFGMDAFEVDDDQTGILIENVNVSGLEIGNIGGGMEIENVVNENNFIDDELEIVMHNEANEGILNNVVAANEDHAFSIQLKESHVNKTSHGVYCSTRLYNIYKDWQNGSTVNLRFRGREWEVVVLRRARSCRFGKGWDTFVENNSLRRGKTLIFNFEPPSTFDVSP